MKSNRASRYLGNRFRYASRIGSAVVPALLCLGGCGAFNASFLSSISPDGAGGLSSLTTPPGFVVITFANNAQVDEQLLSFLQSDRGGNLTLTDAERRALRPRIKLSVRVTFTDGSSQVIQFIDGSSNLIDPRFSALAFPDLNQNDLNNVVVVCDVAAVTLEPGAPIEVFVPVVLNQLELVETADQGGATIRTFEQRAQITPRFRALQFDGVDGNGTIIQRNIGVQDLPGDVVNPICGSVIGIVIDGTLSVPFHPQGGGEPSFDQDDEPSVGSIGGRFEFRVDIG